MPMCAWSPGSDGIHPRVLKKLYCELPLPLIYFLTIPWKWVLPLLSGNKTEYQLFTRRLSGWVSINGHNSARIAATSGIPQGSVLGPNLFLIYMNDLPSVINSFIFLFADYAKTFRVIKHVEDATLLQGDLASLQDWCSKWLLSLHPDKCKHITIGKPANTDYNLVAHGITTGIESVLWVKDIGIILDSKLDFHRHISENQQSKPHHGYSKENLSIP